MLLSYCLVVWALSVKLEALTGAQSPPQLFLGDNTNIPLNGHATWEYLALSLGSRKIDIGVIK